MIGDIVMYTNIQLAKIKTNYTNERDAKDTNIP